MVQIVWKVTVRRFPQFVFRVLDQHWWGYRMTGVRGEQLALDDLRLEIIWEQKSRYLHWRDNVGKTGKCALYQRASVADTLRMEVLRVRMCFQGLWRIITTQQLRAG